MEYIYLVFLLGALGLAGVAKLIRSSGTSHILTIDYSDVTDTEQLHRWAARCFSATAYATALLALAAFAAPSFAELLLVLFCVLVCGTTVAIALGVRKFKRA